MHEIYMNRALSLASLGMKKTSPNPMVGCVIVKNNRIIGQGWHKKYGNPHAEIEALNDAKNRGEDVRNSTLYVTLEPCSHYGKTPPCANRIVSEGISEVITAMRDPNPKVNGNGIKILREAGIKVIELGGEFEKRAKFLNRGFVHVHTLGRPFVNLKMAFSLDGRMCLANSSSKWLTGIEARTEAHKIRAENDAVLVGVKTVLTDNPELTVRNVNGINPLRVVLDTMGRTPSDSKIIGNDGKCLILTSENADNERIKILRTAGAEVVVLNSRGAYMDIKSALEYLAGRGILTLMVEGGAEILSSFLREKLADYASIFIAPKILGEGRSLDLKMNFNSVSEAFNLKDTKIKLLCKDILIEGNL